MRELTTGKNLTAGSSTTVYTIPKGCKGIVTFLLLANHSNNTKHITASWFDHSENTTVDIVAAKSLTSKEILQFTDIRIVMDEFDEFRCTPEASSNYAVIFTVEIHQSTAYQNGA
jgi:hypothetical protein